MNAGGGIYSTKQRCKKMRVARSNILCVTRILINDLDECDTLHNYLFFNQSCKLEVEELGFWLGLHCQRNHKCSSLEYLTNCQLLRLQDGEPAALKLKKYI